MKKILFILFLFPVLLHAQTDVIILTEENKEAAEYRIDDRNVIRPIQLPDGSWFIRSNLVPFIADKGKVETLKKQPKTQVRELPDKGTVEKGMIYKSKYGLVVCKKNHNRNKKADIKDCPDLFVVNEREEIGAVD